MRPDLYARILLLVLILPGIASAQLFHFAVGHLKLEYTPDKITLGIPTTFLSYSTGVHISYQVLTHEDFFSGEESLETQLPCFIRTIFDENQTCLLTPKLKEIAKFQAELFGIGDGATVISRKIKGTDYDILANYTDDVDRKVNGIDHGYIYIFARHGIHRIGTHGMSESEFLEVLNSISKRER